MPEQTVTPKQVIEALAAELDRRSECARHLDNARRELVAAAKHADRTELRAVDMDIQEAKRDVDRARKQLIGSDDE